MRVAFFSAKSYDQASFDQANQEFGHDLTYFDTRLTADTVTLAQDFPAICAFINDDLGARILHSLADTGTQLLALRSAGFNHVDLNTAKDLGIAVVRVPAYSPYAVAEHAVGLILMLNRKLYRSYNRVRDDNFALQGLLGFDLHRKTVGVIGTGQIGQCFAQIMQGFGCRVIAYDVHPNPSCVKQGIDYLDLLDVMGQSDILSLHCPLVPTTYHLINEDTLQALKPGAMLINTSRGALVDTKAVITGIKSGQIGYFGTDVYEEEENLFFEDLSDHIIQDDTFQLLQSFPNVVITAHQAFFTQEALATIAQTTLANIRKIEQGYPCENQL
ncbi:2-hydroxyacid dehydrogenase [Lyngbya confervoides]|uniref:2-hydroxyacid dehydrogenase n=1 Tax=Lyngbya confervoides BDU141951 TaxID=1574623 RepID=A0ABD4T2W0_9CYAN|nr:2-hydroxyacid dehydrogenase [Lyngbya confervoides]MCM1982572.1 2-hydroxyacid dehydrogenase [Lyngbya confervoides BDU141951]